MPIKPPSIFASFHLAAACLGASTLSYQALGTSQLHSPLPPHTAPLTRASSGSLLSSSAASMPLKREGSFDVRYQFTACQTV